VADTGQLGSAREELSGRSWRMLALGLAREKRDVSGPRAMRSLS
jgi:hypothetical protein